MHPGPADPGSFRSIAADFHIARRNTKDQRAAPCLLLQRLLRALAEQ
jgi:hypothetical protein